MIRYGVTLFPIPMAPISELEAVFTRLLALVGVIPGLESVELVGYDRAQLQATYSYRFTFDTAAHLQIYNTHPAYLALRPELNRLSPKTVVTSMQVTVREMRIIPPRTSE